MKLVTSMVGKRWESGKYLYYMKLLKCRECGYEKTVPITQAYRERCPICKSRKTEYRWRCIGDKLDYSDYFSQKELKKPILG